MGEVVASRESDIRRLCRAPFPAFLAATYRLPLPPEGGSNEAEGRSVGVTRMCRSRRVFGGGKAHHAHESPWAVRDDPLHRQWGRLGRATALPDIGLRLQCVVFTRRPVDRVHVRARRLGPG